MIIKGIKYERYPEAPRQWRIVGKDDDSNEDYAYFGNLNLLVGKNASGKSRTLRAIYELANLMCGRQLVKETVYHTQHFDILFENNNKEYRYVLYFKEKEIIEETLYINNNKILDRANGLIVISGQQKNISSNLDPDKLVLTQKQNNGELYFEELYTWAASLRTFLFSDQLEKNEYVANLSSQEDGNTNSENPAIIIPVFHSGREQFGQKFEDEILECMNELGYKLTDIAIKKLSQGYSICVEESGKYIVSQQEMSHGMFRALAFFVLLVNARWRELSVCMLIDDVGEGLDHERAKSLVDLVIKKTHDTQIQYFMTSNDRYIMNQIHLKYWTVIERVDDKSIFYNMFNSQDTFEDFRYTGLNNFDFYTTSFYRDGFGDDDSPEESN